MNRLTILVAAVLLCAAAPAQTATYSVVGSGCATGRLNTAIGPVPFAVQGVPRIGGAFTIVTEGTCDYPWGVRRQVFLLTGVSNTSALGVPLPFDIATLAPGEPFCGLLRTSAEVIELAPLVSDYRTPARITISVPNDPRLAGANFFQQVLSIERTTFGPPFRALALSAGGHGTVGF